MCTPLKGSRGVLWPLLVLLLSGLLALTAGIAYATYLQISRPLPAVVRVVSDESPELVGDVDGNGVVDIRDLVLVAASFNTSPPANPLADVNKDGIVNLFDLALVSINFGKSQSP